MKTLTRTHLKWIHAALLRVAREAQDEDSSICKVYGDALESTAEIITAILDSNAKRIEIK